MNAAPVVSRAAARRAVAQWRRAGKTIVFTNGCFDILHAGHAALFERAHRAGDRLIVGLNTDASVRGLKGPGRPRTPLADRARILGAVRWVDLVVPFSEATPLELIRTLAPDVLVKGSDYRACEIVGEREVRARGGKVLRVKLLPGRSTTRLLAGRHGRRRAEAPARLCRTGGLGETWGQPRARRARGATAGRGFAAAGVTENGEAPI